jgi:hypothetical protein
MQRFVLTCLCGGSRAGLRLSASWPNTLCLAREPVALANLVRTFGSLAPHMLTPTRRYVSSAGWHDWRYKPHPNASDEQIWSPVYEAIRDYWIDSRLGPVYSPH